MSTLGASSSWAGYTVWSFENGQAEVVVVARLCWGEKGGILRGMVAALVTAPKRRTEGMTGKSMVDWFLEDQFKQAGLKFQEQEVASDGKLLVWKPMILTGSDTFSY